MSARHINQNQLAMFMPARQLASMKLGDRVGDESNESLFQRKRESTAERGWDFSGGIKEPVEVFHSPTNTRLLNGHNRLTAAHDQGPATEVPVQHTDAMNFKPLQTHREMEQDRLARKQRFRPDV